MKIKFCEQENLKNRLTIDSFSDISKGRYIEVNM